MSVTFFSWCPTPRKLFIVSSVLLVSYCHFPVAFCDLPYLNVLSSLFHPPPFFYVFLFSTSLTSVNQLFWSFSWLTLLSLLSRKYLFALLFFLPFLAFLIVFYWIYPYLEEKSEEKNSLEYLPYSTIHFQAGDEAYHSIHFFYHHPFFFLLFSILTFSWLFFLHLSKIISLLTFPLLPSFSSEVFLVVFCKFFSSSSLLYLSLLHSFTILFLFHSYLFHYLCNYSLPI